MTQVFRRLRPHYDRQVTIILIIFGLAAYWSMYTLTAYDVASQYIFTQWSSLTRPIYLTSYWRSPYNGTLFPWPTVWIQSNFPGSTPQPALLPTDQFIYSYLLKTGALVVICVALWISGFSALLLYAFRRANESLYQRLTAERPTQVTGPEKSSLTRKVTRTPVPSPPTSRSCVIPQIRTAHQAGFWGRYLNGASCI